MAPNPACEVKNGSAAYVATTNGVDITTSETIIIRLSSQADVDSWDIRCITTDDQSDASTITASLVIDSLNKTATFTAPSSTGRALRFRSKVNGGVSRDGTAQSTYETTFCLYTLVNGRRVLAADEQTEGNSTYGWIVWINNIIRSFPATAPASVAGSQNQVQYNASGFAGATGLKYLPTTMQTELTPIMVGTTVMTGTAFVAVGNARHRRASELVSLKTSDDTAGVLFAWNLLNEAVTTVVVEAEAVPSGGAGALSAGRRAKIRADGGVATMGALENMYGEIDAGAGFTGANNPATGEAQASGFLRLWIGHSGMTGFVRVVGTPTGRIDWGAAVSRSETSWS